MLVEIRHSGLYSHTHSELMIRKHVKCKMAMSACRVANISCREEDIGKAADEAFGRFHLVGLLRIMSILKQCILFKHRSQQCFRDVLALQRGSGIGCR